MTRVETHNDAMEMMLPKMKMLIDIAIDETNRKEKRIFALLDLKEGLEKYEKVLSYMTREELFHIFECDTCPDKDICSEHNKPAKVFTFPVRMN